jgi:hypothetical protein
MSELALSKFYDELDSLVEKHFPSGTRYSSDRLIALLQSKHRDQITELEPILETLGLRVLLRRHRSKRGSPNDGAQAALWSGIHVKKRISVPYIDDKGRHQWDSKNRSTLLIDEAEEVLSKWAKQPEKTRDRRDWERLLKLIRPYRSMTNSVEEALAMARRDGRNWDSED